MGPRKKIRRKSWKGQRLREDLWILLTGLGRVEGETAVTSVEEETGAEVGAETDEEILIEDGEGMSIVVITTLDAQGLAKGGEKDIQDRDLEPVMGG